MKLIYSLIYFFYMMWSYTFGICKRNYHLSTIFLPESRYTSNGIRRRIVMPIIINNDVIFKYISWRIFIYIFKKNACLIMIKKYETVFFAYVFQYQMISRKLPIQTLQLLGHVALTRCWLQSGFANVHHSSWSTQASEITKEYMCYISLTQR